ncbi:hypothetical protein E2C01_037789 [Portunus trituberculatus]|uniref:Uncharacterized protein n=1 Tax=Portunus trituberculatus TaxID=210409 RepID=A0A5B7FEZ0_PORTR|nr:hypothetical protein [Portunus trituberculatus]
MMPLLKHHAWIASDLRHTTSSDNIYVLPGHILIVGERLARGGMGRHAGSGTKSPTQAPSRQCQPITFQ